MFWCASHTHLKERKKEKSCKRKKERKRNRIATKTGVRDTHLISLFLDEHA